MKSFPWDSLVTDYLQVGDDRYPIYDRTYTADDWREIYKTFFSIGVFLDEADALQVTENGGMTVLVSPGKTHINGTIGWELSTRELQLQEASSQDRIDTVVLRWNADIEARTIDLYVLQGVASATPARPALTRSETVYELGLCDIYIPRGTTAISQTRITDTRLEAARCGQVVPFAKIDLTTFYNQINATLAEMKDELDRQTQRAVELAQSALDGTVAGDLQNKIENLQDGKVNRAGDTMTGKLNIDGNNITVTNKDASFELVGDNGYSFRLHNYNGSDGVSHFAVYDKQRVVNAFEIRSDGNFYFSGGTIFISGTSFLNKTYPVGSYYISNSSTSPASLFGGTWTQLEVGRFIRSANDTATGGANSLALTVAQIPRHQHLINYNNTSGSSTTSKSNPLVNYTTATADNTKCAEVGTKWVGETAAFNNMPAYKDAYIWYRTA